MRVCDLEGHPHWKQIVESVQCPVCGAPSGIPCANLSAAPRTLAAQQPRNDWHQERKFQAAIAWQAGMDQVTNKVHPENTEVDEVRRDQ